MPNVPGATFIPGATSIPESRVSRILGTKYMGSHNGFIAWWFDTLNIFFFQIAMCNQNRIK